MHRHKNDPKTQNNNNNDNSDNKSDHKSDIDDVNDLIATSGDMVDLNGNKFDWNKLITSDLNINDTTRLVECLIETANGKEINVCTRPGIVLDILLLYQRKLISKYGTDNVNRVNLKTLCSKLSDISKNNDSKIKVNLCFVAVFRYLEDYDDILFNSENNSIEFKWYFELVHNLSGYLRINCDFVELCKIHNNLSLLKKAYAIYENEWNKYIKPLNSFASSEYVESFRDLDHSFIAPNPPSKERYKMLRWMCEQDVKNNKDTFVNTSKDNDDCDIANYINDMLTQSFDYDMLIYFWDFIEDHDIKFTNYKSIYSVIVNGDIDVLKKILLKYPKNTFYSPCDIANGMMPIELAYSLSKHKMVDFMLSTKENRIKFLNNENGDMLDVFCHMFDIGKFCNELYNNVIKKLNIQSWKEFENKYLFKYKKNNNNKLSEWKSVATNYYKSLVKLGRESRNKYDIESKYDRFETFLNQLDIQVFLDQNFPKLLAIVESMTENNKTDNNNNNDTIELSDDWLKFRRDNAICDFIYDRLKEHNDNNNYNSNEDILSVLSNVINDGISNQSCPLTDSWMLLSKKINEKKFIEAIEHCCKIGMKHGNNDNNGKNNNNSDMMMDEKNENDDTSVITNSNSNYNGINTKDRVTQNQTYFKNYILPSNIFAQSVGKPADENCNKRLLFDIIDENVVSNELVNQKKFIKDEIIKIEKNMNDAWNNIKTKINETNVAVNKNIQQNMCIINYKNNSNDSIYTSDIMQRYGIKCKYNNINDLPSSSIGM